MSVVCSFMCSIKDSDIAANLHSDSNLFFCAILINFAIDIMEAIRRKLGNFFEFFPTWSGGHKKVFLFPTSVCRKCVGRAGKLGIECQKGSPAPPAKIEEVLYGSLIIGDLSLIQ
jgi:hypothetical protein